MAKEKITPVEQDLDEQLLAAVTAAIAVDDSLSADGKLNPSINVTLPVELYEKALPKGITLDTVNRVRAHDDAVAAALISAASNLGLNNAHVKDVRINMDMGTGSAGRAAWEHSRTVSGGVPKDGVVPPRVEKFGVATFKYATPCDQISAAIDRAHVDATAKFAKKAAEAVAEMV